MEYQGTGGATVSPWHDVPISPAPGAVNFVCEIPKFERAKMECDTKRPHNPIVQDVKKGKPRFYHGPIFWNYGFVPQTWEDPSERDAELGFLGDGDPLDVVEIGAAKREMGSVTAVKPLGVLAMIDDGEVDWKMICVACDDPLAAELDDIADVDAKCPGVVSGIREWFRWCVFVVRSAPPHPTEAALACPCGRGPRCGPTVLDAPSPLLPPPRIRYKTPDGKPLNAFGFEERALDKAKAKAVLEHTHASWRALVDGTCDAAGRWTAAAPVEAAAESAPAAVDKAEEAAASTSANEAAMVVA
jgi:inorganic pyrophosphatase